MSEKTSAIESPADREIISTRVFAATPAQVFAAFADPARLALWWGPNGFKNTLHEFDLRVGGKWRLTMHGPDGANYENVSEFLEIVPAARVVYQHLEPVHRFRMTMTFAPRGPQTELTWTMRFENADEVAKIGKFIVAANEQNFDRLAAHLAQKI